MAAAEYVTTSQAAALLRCSAQTVVNLANSGQLPCAHVPGSKHRRFLRDDVLALAAQRQPQKTEAAS